MSCVCYKGLNLNRSHPFSTHLFIYSFIIIIKKQNLHIFPSKALEKQPLKIKSPQPIAFAQFTLIQILPQKQNPSPFRVKLEQPELLET